MRLISSLSGQLLTLYRLGDLARCSETGPKMLIVQTRQYSGPTMHWTSNALFVKPCNSEHMYLYFAKNEGKQIR